MGEIRSVTWGEVLARAQALRIRMKKLHGATHPFVYGVPRGGATVAALVGTPVDQPEQADFIVDDLIDSGRTRDEYAARFKKPVLALFDKTDGDAGEPWLVFPWEEGTDALGPGDAVRRLIQYVGEDPDREGLRDTPARVVRALAELTAGYAADPEKILERRFAETADEVIMVRDIPFWSLCEHHLLPFHGTATVGYLPSDRIVGLSKLPRLVQAFAQRLQVQERMTQQIAQAVMDHLGAQGAGCVVRAVHTCMAARGVRSASPMETSALFGKFRDGLPRAEFLALVTSRAGGA